MSDRLAVLHQYALPKRAMTELAGKAASARAGALTTWAIRRFVKRYGVNMSEAADPRHRELPELQRVLHPRAEARRAAAGAVRPDLPGGRRDQPLRRDGPQQDPAGQGPPLPRRRAARRRRGAGDAVRPRHFATLYLAPKDYHRIHMPCDGRLTRMIHVPGALFSVNPPTARGIPGL